MNDGPFAILVFCWIWISIAILLYASRIGRSGILWFFISLIFSPALSWIMLLAIGSHAQPGQPSASPVTPIAQTNTAPTDAQKPAADDRSGILILAIGMVAVAVAFVLFVGRR